MFFPLLLSRFKRIEIIIKIKANFYKEIAQFTILIAIIGNKISKYFFLTSLSQILYISTRQTYTSGKFNSRDSAWYNLFSFSDTSRSQIIAKESVARTIELSWQNTSELANLLPVRSSVVIDRTKSGLYKQRKSEQKNGHQNKRNQQPRLIEPLITLGGGY